jgi:pantetheine-phosphate adenylyltransferase
MAERLAIYPGSFDPFTCGHLDIVERAARLFDRVIVTIARNSKKKPLFSIDERVEMIHDATSKLVNVDTEVFTGLLTDFAGARRAVAIIRGLRATSDFEYEFQMALMNHKLNQSITTVFLMPNEKYTYLNSSIVKEVAEFGGNIDHLVTPMVAGKLKEKFKEKED